MNKKTGNIVKKLVFCILISYLLLSPIISYSQQQEETIKKELFKLVSNSDYVSLGTVMSKESFWFGDTIMTTAKVKIEKNLKNSINGIVDYTYEGGEVGDVGLITSNSVSVNKGDHLIMFFKDAEIIPNNSNNTEKTKSQTDNFVINKVIKLHTKTDEHILKIEDTKSIRTLNENEIVQTLMNLFLRNEASYEK